jgi:hypothetical protein
MYSFICHQETYTTTDINMSINAQQRLFVLHREEEKGKEKRKPG